MISVTWDGTTYSIPQAGEINWPSLTNFLVALGQKAAVADEMKQSIRKATTSPVTVVDSGDFAIVTDLSVAGPVTVNLPVGVQGRIFVIVDGKGDAATNNVTINRGGTDTIASATSFVMNKNRQVVMLQYIAADLDWKLINYCIPPGQVTDSDISGVISTAGKVSGDAITSGTIAGSTSLNSSGSVTLTGSGALSVAGTAALNGGVTLGDQTADALTINSSAASIPNGLNFDSNTLVIDAANNRVGVGIAAPTVALDVVGAAKVSTDLTVNGNTVLGDATGDTLTIAGNATQNGTGFFKVASGSNADRPGSPVDGMIRYNTDLTSFEGRSNGAWSAIGGGGTVDKVSQGSHGFVVGDVLYLNGATYAKAIATTAATAEVVGVVSRVVDASNFELTLNGEVSGLTALTAGEVYFLSSATAGALTVTEPTTIGQVSIPVGVASSTTTLYVAPKRGVVVGGANARTQVSLANNATSTVQDVSTYEAGELAGWVFIDATTDLRFYVQAQFVKGGDNNYDLAYQVAGDTPPAGFLMSITNAGVIQITMPSVTGFSSASINYALNAPAVGTNFPLTVSGTQVVGGIPTVDTINENTNDNGVQIEGRVNGSAIPAGYIGQTVTSTGTNGVNQTGTVSSALIFNAAGAPALSLNAGVWLVQGFTSISNATTSDDAILRLYDNTAAATFGGGTCGTVTTTDYRPFSTSGVLNFTGATRTIYLHGNRNGASTLKMGTTGVNIPCGFLIATRIG